MSNFSFSLELNSVYLFPWGVLFPAKIELRYLGLRTRRKQVINVRALKFIEVTQRDEEK